MTVIEEIVEIIIRICDCGIIFSFFQSMAKKYRLGKAIQCFAGIFGKQVILNFNYFLERPINNIIKIQFNSRIQKLAQEFD